MRCVDCLKQIVCITATITIATSLARTQEITKYEKERVALMLSRIADDVASHYYDRHVHGLDWKKIVAGEKEKIENEKSLNMALSHVAAALDQLNDSHTFFLPPPRPYIHHLGFMMQMVGDDCFVTHVRAKSDAESKGLKPGDKILAINGYKPARDNLWKMNYVFRILRPQMKLQLRIAHPDGSGQTLEVLASVQQLRHVTDLTNSMIWSNALSEMEDAVTEQRPEVKEVGKDLTIARIPSFMFDDFGLNHMIDTARKHSSLILDLRGNPGGSEDLLRRVVGDLFPHDVKIADRVTRDSTKPLIAKSTHGAAFQGKLVVLIDSRSASAAELLARVVQLEKRGTVLGDDSSGSVMEALQYNHESGLDFTTFYGASITSADLIMADGNSLEHHGVLPDEKILPMGDDMAHDRDPVLAKAAQLLGAALSPEDAGKLFPFEWPKDHTP